MNKLKYFIFDAYNHQIYPGDTFAKQAISLDIDFAVYNTDERFLLKLGKELPKAVRDFQPEMIIYNAGTDCLVGDPLGNLDISAEGIVQRDELVFRVAKEANIPIVMLLSGGY